MVKIAYSWSIYQGAGFTNSGSAPRTYADAYSSTYGLTDGEWEVYAKVNHQGLSLVGVLRRVAQSILPINMWTTRIYMLMPILRWRDGPPTAAIM